ncbi:MAG: hypothetical protein H6744_18340 [Deltaproteobacteria bacterium]|nr:hypothetical protein [Deltaproteobacteria bacterium]MCB9788640.1 hypothetical protein [Deltaproteobacteria bacterium]
MRRTERRRSGRAGLALGALLGWALVGACSSGGTTEVVDSGPRDEGVPEELPRDAGDTRDAELLDAALDGTVDADPPDDGALAEAETSGPEPLSCAPEPLAVSRLALPEASGAVWIDAPIGRGWLVLADSGNEGAGALLNEADLQTQPLTFKLDAGAGDDLEGLTLTPSGRLVGLVSSGYLREWSADAAPLDLTRLAAPITDDADYLCDPKGGNCGANFEGLCLHPAPKPGGACAGFAVSKARGELVCVVETPAGYRLDTTRRITVGEADQLSGCDFELEAPHRLVVAGNLFSFSALWEVTGYQDPATAQARSLSLTGAANQEAIAFGPAGLLISFGDTQGLGGVETSPMVGFRCH